MHHRVTYDVTVQEHVMSPHVECLNYYGKCAVTITITVRVFFYLTSLFKDPVNI